MWMAGIVSEAGAPRVYPEGRGTDDRRWAPVKDLDGYFPLNVPETRDAWMVRAEKVRRQVRVTMGLWPWPTRTSLNAVVHGRRDMGDYTVEKVYFESAPGLFVTGSLYRPKGRTGRMPGVLSPHGHWSQGRFMDAGDLEARREVARGAERWIDGGRSPLQARCVTLARMGCVVFHYDMPGYADNQQLSMELVHGFAKQRPEMQGEEGWGFYSARAESRFQSVMGVQAWNTIRALDFLESLPDVDPARLGVTGASGGGTQTFIVGAIDPRPAVVVPAVMVSTAMQGGCTCENASGLRVGTGNVELAALFAPKPQGLTGADDWTRDMPTQGFPELQRVYEVMGAKDAVQLTHLPHFGHNYNHVSRSAMYQWFNRHLGLGLPEPVLEENFTRLTAEELTVWGEDHPRPEGGVEFERRLLRMWDEDASVQLSAAAATTEGWRTVVQPAIETTLGRTLAEVGPVQWLQSGQKQRSGYTETVGVARLSSQGEEVPMVVLEPSGYRKGTVVWVTPTGKDGLYTADGEVIEEVRRRLDTGTRVIGVDLVQQGESHGPEGLQVRTRKVANPREAPAYTFGYNTSVFQQRVHDVLTAVAYAAGLEGGKAVGLKAGSGAAHWVRCAAAVAGEAVSRVEAESETFRFAGVSDVHDPDFVPGGVRYLDPFVLDRVR